MNILVCGSEGQLGKELKYYESISGCDVVYTDVKDLDICSKEAVANFLDAGKYDAIINCAAYTAVDKAEEEVKAAFAVNAEAPKILAEASKARNILLIHVSTDYVFDGFSALPYRESDLTNAMSVYGKSKREGEKAIEEAGGRALILRTSWLYSAFGNNFVKTMRRIASERACISVVFDQIGSPTWAGDLAQAIWKILPMAIESSKGVEIYHYSNEGVCSWYDFACEILEQSKIYTKVYPIESSDFPTLAHRPINSVLNKKKIKEAFNIEIPHWKESLKKILRQL